MPIALAPVLGNPLSLAAAGVNRSLPLQEQARASGPNREAAWLLCPAGLAAGQTPI